MQAHRSIARRRLDERLNVLATHVGAAPPDGWTKTIRRALGMTLSEFAERLGVSPSRASRLERAEIAGSIRLSTLRRVAEAVDCELLYAFVPNEPLEDMVRRQARRKAAEWVGLLVDDERPEDQAVVAKLLNKLLDARALELVDTPGLWRESARPSAEPGPPSF
jgi:predicted DNA-binding mobile mystery protein A